MAIYDVRRRLQGGDRSGAVISALANLIAPRLEVESHNSPWWGDVPRPRRPKSVSEILRARLTSGDLVDLRVLRLNEIGEVEFLVALANQLEGAVNRGVDIARRIGWDGKGQFIHLGGLYWAAYAEDAEKTRNKHEPDKVCRGIAPAVKLLHAVVMRIHELELTSARAFLKRWLVSRSAVHVRLWAASALGGGEARSVDIGSFLTGLDDNCFWRVSDFPEVAAVRAVHFGKLEPDVQKKVVARLRKGPPRELLPAKVNKARVKEASLYWKLRELKRIEVAGGELPAELQGWLDSEIGHVPNLADMPVEHGFPEGPKVRAVLPSPDARFDLLTGDARLRALEKAISSGPSGWLNSTSKGAEDWLMQADKLETVLGDLESSRDSGDRFPRRLEPVRLVAHAGSGRDGRDFGKRPPESGGASP